MSVAARLVGSDVKSKTPRKPAPHQARARHHRARRDEGWPISADSLRSQDRRRANRYPYRSAFKVR